MEKIEEKLFYIKEITDLLSQLSPKDLEDLREYTVKQNCSHIGMGQFDSGKYFVSAVQKRDDKYYVKGFWLFDNEEDATNAQLDLISDHLKTKNAE